MAAVKQKESNADVIGPKFYARWAKIYTEKGRADGWPAAREWARRTFDAPTHAKLRDAINQLWGIKQ